MFIRYERTIYDSCNGRIIYGSCNGRIILLVVLLLVVPTELTEYTEAYGLKVLESTERIDAARHTTEGTELIACVYKKLFPSFGKAERGEEECW